MIKEVLQRPLIVHIENGQLVLERWAFTATYSAIIYLSKVCTPPHLIIDHSETLKKRLPKLLKILHQNAGKHLIWLVVTFGILIFLLLLLTPLVVLYAVQQALVLSLRGLTYLRTKH